MIFNKMDVKLFLGGIWFDVIINKRGDRLSWLKACVNDYIRYGGQICNKHNCFHCSVCKSNSVSYRPYSYGPYWQKEVIKNEK